MVKVLHGANEQSIQPGQTIGAIRQELKDVLNIEEGAAAVLSGDNVSDDYVLREGDVLEFVA